MFQVTAQIPKLDGEDQDLVQEVSLEHGEPLPQEQLSSTPAVSPVTCLATLTKSFVVSVLVRGSVVIMLLWALRSLQALLMVAV